MLEYVGLMNYFNVIGLSVLNNLFINMGYDVTKHLSHDHHIFNSAVPLAFGANFGDYYIGVSSVSDGDHAILPFNSIMGVGFGLGNSKTIVGFDNYIAISSVNPFGGEGVAHDSHYGFKLHKEITDTAGFAFGSENLISRGRDKNFYGSYYMSATQLFPIKETLLIFTLGLGTGRFYSSDYYRKDDSGNGHLTPVGFFASTAYFVLPEFGFQISSVANNIGALFFSTPFAFMGVQEIMFGLGFMDIRNEIVENNVSVSISYLGSF